MLRPKQLKRLRCGKCEGLAAEENKRKLIYKRLNLLAEKCRALRATSKQLLTENSGCVQCTAKLRGWYVLLREQLLARGVKV